MLTSLTTELDRRKRSQGTQPPSGRLPQFPYAKNFHPARRSRAVNSQHETSLQLQNRTLIHNNLFTPHYTQLTINANTPRFSPQLLLNLISTLSTKDVDAEALASLFLGPSFPFLPIYFPILSNSLILILHLRPSIPTLIRIPIHISPFVQSPSQSPSPAIAIAIPH